MRIEKIRLGEFCCFEDIELEFDPRFNLLIGVNGSGKTSVLKALRAVLQYLGPENEKVNSESVIKSEERREEVEKINGRFRFLQKMPSIHATVCHSPTEIDEYEINIQSKAGETFSTISRAWDSRVDQSLILFYKSNRKWQWDSSIAPEAAIQKKVYRLDAYSNWSSASEDIVNLGTWIILLTLARLQNVYEGHDVPEHDELDIINQAIARCLDGASGIKYDIGTRSLMVEWIDGRPATRFDHLSDGQRALCALVADIARRACILNPHLGKEVIQKTPGVVLIDELDLHLHPAWQRIIPGALKEAFPAIQFICTAHSPQIIGELKPQEILILNNGKVHNPAVTFGMDSNWILNCMMGANSRDPVIGNRIDQLFECLENDEVERAKELIGILSKDMGRVDDVPDLVEARAMLEEIERNQHKEIL